MTTTFDALNRLIQKYRDTMSSEDYHILHRFIETIHDLQHSENSHRIDSLIEHRIGADLPIRKMDPIARRFKDLRDGSA